MRIAFSGCSGTGKTTLAEHVARKYGLTMCPVGARSVAKSMGYDNPYDVDATGKRGEFQRRLFEEKRAWEAEHEDFVTDRTVLDCLTYEIVDGDPKTFRGGEVRAASEAAQRYDLVVFTPRDAFQSLDDPCRVQQVEYHVVYEGVLRAFVSNAVGSPRLVWLYVSDIDRRKRAVDREIAARFGR